MTRTYLVRGDVRVEITHCFWCGGREYVCGACVAKLEAAVEANHNEGRANHHGRNTPETRLARLHCDRVV